MNSSAITLVVTGPAPHSGRGDAAAASALLRELHARTILHVDQVTGGPDGDADVSLPDPGRLPEQVDRGDVPDSRTSAARKGAGPGSLAELVVTGLFSATTVTALAQVVIAFVQRGAARRITLRDGGRTLTISDPDEETERMVTEWLGVPPQRNGAGSGAD
jgi:hypothetical protein